MLYQSNLILNSNLGLVLFRQKQMLRSNRHKNFQKQNSEDFFTQLLNAFLHFANNNVPTLTSVEEIIDQPISLNPHTKLDFSTDKSYLYCIPPRNISDKFTIIRDLSRFLQPGLILSPTFDKTVGFPTANRKRIYKLIMDFIPNDWKHLLRTETTQKSILKTFYYNNKSTRKVKDFQILSNKEFFFILQDNSIKYNMPFKFISWANFLEGHHTLSPEI